MFNNDLISDVKFTVQESDGSKKEIPAHKFVLYAMFYGTMADSNIFSPGLPTNNASRML